MNDTTSYPNQTTQKQLSRHERTQAALFAMDMHLNAFPLALDSKLPIKGSPVKALDYMRFFWQQKECREVFEVYDCNIGIKLGETSFNAFVVDIDDPERAVDVMLRLAGHQIRTLTIKSPKRGYHFYFCCTTCAVGVSKFTYGDIKGQGGFTLFSGSAVDGKPYTLIDASEPHTDTLSNLEALISDILGESVTLKPTTYGRKIYSESAPGEVVFQRGRWIARYCEYLDTPTPIGNRKNKLYKNAHYALATGRGLSAVESAAQRDGLPQSEIDRTLTAAQRDHASATSATGGQSWHWNKALKFADTYHGWSKGQHGLSERAVMLALIERARMDANEQGVFRASIREIAQLAQRSYTKGVSLTLTRLIGQGLITRVSGSRRKGLQDSATVQPISLSQKLEASQWQFTDKVCKSDTLETKGLKETDTVNVSVMHTHEFTRDTHKAELLERGSIGQTGIRLHAYLTANNGAPTPQVIATALGVNRSTIARTLVKLRDTYKLVEYSEDDHRWYATTMDDDQWNDLAQADIERYGKSRYKARKERFGMERHNNLLGIYHKILAGYQRRLDWQESKDSTPEPPETAEDFANWVAEEFEAKKTYIASRGSANG